MYRAFAFFLVLAAHAGGQTRSELAARYGQPRAEVFLLPESVKLTATYDDGGRVCSYRIETAEHSVKVTPRVSDGRYWMDAEQTSRLIAQLVPSASREGTLQKDTTDLDVGERMVVESDDTVQITRLQRSRPLMTSPLRPPVEDRLITILWKRAGCPLPGSRP